MTTTKMPAVVYYIRELSIYVPQGADGKPDHVTPLDITYKELQANYHKVETPNSVGLIKFEINP